MGHVLRGQLGRRNVFRVSKHWSEPHSVAWRHKSNHTRNCSITPTSQPLAAPHPRPIRFQEMFPNFSMAISPRGCKLHPNWCDLFLIFLKIYTFWNESIFWACLKMTSVFFNYCLLSQKIKQHLSKKADLAKILNGIK